MTTPDPALLESDTLDLERKVARRDQKVTELTRTNKYLHRELEIAQERVNVALAISEAKQPPAIKARKRGPKSQATAVWCASDWHFGEYVDPRTVNFRNEFTPEIGQERGQQFFIKALRLLEIERSAVEIDTGVLWCGGDLISGAIHEELLESDRLSPTEAILLVQDSLSAGIRFLLDRGELSRLIVPCNFGNHGRTTQKKRVSTAAQNSFEWLMYQSLARQFEGENRVEFLIADGHHLYLDIYGRTVRFAHGDEGLVFRGGLGGISVPFRKAVDAWALFRPAYYTMIGHWHQLIDFGFGGVNGSLVGFNAYALSRVKARYEPPQQAFWLIDPEHGKTTFRPIYVTEGKKSDG